MNNATFDESIKPLTMNQLGESGLWLTHIGLGTWAIGGNSGTISWGAQNDTDSIATIHKAIDLGINWIDTAPIYGMGHSEEIVGRAVKESDVKPLIFTKCGLVWNEQRETRRTLLEIRREVEESLRRLQREAIDLYQIHWPVEDHDIEEAWSTMADLQREGKVLHIGVSNFSVQQMERCLNIAPITSLQPPYSMINRSIETEILPFCKEHNIGVINYSPMHSGLLTGTMTKERVANLPADDFRRGAKNYQEPVLGRNLAIGEFLKQIGKRHGVPAGVIAIAWTLRNKAVTAAIVGGRSPEQIEEIWGAAKFRILDEEKAEIDAYLEAHPAP